MLNLRRTANFAFALLLGSSFLACSSSGGDGEDEAVSTYSYQAPLPSAEALDRGGSVKPAQSLGRRLLCPPPR